MDLKAEVKKFLAKLHYVAKVDFLGLKDIGENIPKAESANFSKNIALKSRTLPEVVTVEAQKTHFLNWKKNHKTEGVNLNEKISWSSKEPRTVGIFDYCKVLKSYAGPRHEQTGHTWEPENFKNNKNSENFVGINFFRKRILRKIT